MLIAGLFLQEFVGRRPWAHLDIAGPAFNEGRRTATPPVGGTGVGVRTLLALLEGRAAGGLGGPALCASRCREFQSRIRCG